MKRPLKQLLKEYNELWLIVISFVAMVVSAPFLRLFDPTSGSFDLGLLQAVLPATFFFAWTTGIAWLAYRLSWPALGKWFDDELESEFLNYRNLSKTIFSMAVYFLYCLIFLIIITQLV